MRVACIFALISFASGCGGGLPLLHPARALPLGDVRAAAGISGNAMVGPAASDLRAALAEAATQSGGPGSNGADATYAKGALALAGIAPGVAPFVSMRVGVGSNFEGGLSYTGRAGRVDLRKAIDRGDVSFSIGAGVSGAFYGAESGGSLPDVQLSQLHGYGADVPLLVGWRSVAGLYEVWGGIRGGFEHDQISQLTSEPKDVTIGTPPIALDGTRFYGGGLVGISAGFRRLHVALEMDVAYESMTGSFDGTHASVSGITLAPAGALWWDF